MILVGSAMGARKRKLPSALAANRWQPGQSGNPSGHSGEYGEAMRLARQAAPDAVRRLTELMQSEDERVAAVACNAILDRAFGKPKEYDPPAKSSYDRLSDQELRRQVLERLVAGGIPEKTARAFVDGNMNLRPASMSTARIAGRSNNEANLTGKVEGSLAD